MLGQVSDPSGTPVADALVNVRNRGTGFSRETRTNKEGEYLLPALPTGAYVVTVTSSGFKTYTRSGILLQVEQNTRVDARLELGQVNESVTGATTVANVDTESATLGATVDRVRVANLALDGPNVLSLATLNSPVNNLGSPTSGRITGAGAARVSQLALRYDL